MRVSRSGSFVCVACDNEMERVPSVPVLQSVQGHAIHHCVGCGHILLVAEDGATVGRTSWLASLPLGRDSAITCALFL